MNDLAGTINALNVGNSTPGFGIGIAALNYGSGNIRVSTAAGTAINSASSGIAAVNRAPSTPGFVVPSTSEISVLAFGTIHSGKSRRLRQPTILRPAFWRVTIRTTPISRTTIFTGMFRSTIMRRSWHPRERMVSEASITAPEISRSSLNPAPTFLPGAMASPRLVTMAAMSA